MQIVPPRYLVPSGRHPIIEALAPEVKSWFADTVAQPIPEELQLILRRIDTTLKEHAQRHGDPVTSKVREAFRFSESKAPLRGLAVRHRRCVSA